MSRDITTTSVTSPGETPGEIALFRSVSNLLSRGRTQATADSERSLDLHANIHTLENEMDRARRGGVLGLMRLRYEAWVEERMVKPAQTKLESQRTILEEQKKTAQAQIALRSTIQSGEQTVEQNRMNFEGLMWQRLAGDIERSGMLLPPAPSHPLLPSADGTPQYPPAGGRERGAAYVRSHQRRADRNARPARRNEHR